MIRSSKISLKFSNKNKREKINLFIEEYKKVAQFFVDIFWEMEKLPKLIDKENTDKVEDSWLSQRAIQCAAKQASGIVRGTKEKNKRRLYIYNKLLKEGKTKRARKLKKRIDETKESKPELKTICPELDGRFVKIDLSNDTSFDGWLTISSLGNKLKLEIPFKKTDHLNNLLSEGKLKNGIRLSNNSFSFNIEKEKELKNEGKPIGLDIGIKKVFVSSDKQIGKPDRDGWTLEKIQKRLASRKKGSAGFRQTQEHRKNYINWNINQINFSDINILKLENIKNMRRNINTSRYMSHWTYTEIYNKLEMKCEESGVQIQKTSPTYTSQRCSQCGWVRKSNRKGEQFKCTACGYATDADLNASVNISLTLPVITKKQRLSKNNRTGFYWLETTGEPIVPQAQKPITYFS